MRLSPLKEHPIRTDFKNGATSHQVNYIGSSAQCEDDTHIETATVGTRARRACTCGMAAGVSQLLAPSRSRVR